MKSIDKYLNYLFSFERRVLVSLCFLSLFNFAFAENTQNSSISDDDSSSLESSFPYCQKTQSIDHTSSALKTKKMTGQSLEEEFYSKLLKKVKARSLESLFLADLMVKCFQSPQPPDINDICLYTRNWVNPKRYILPPSSKPFHNIYFPEPSLAELEEFNNNENNLFRISGRGRPSADGREGGIIQVTLKPTPWEKSLSYGVKYSRSVLSSVNDEHPFQPNVALKYSGYKGIQWNPLSSDEIKSSKQTIQSFVRSQILQKEGGLSQTELEALVRPIPPRQLTGNLEMSEDELKQRMIKADLSQYRGLVSEKYKFFRNGNLAVYQRVLSDFPIINFLSSREPSEAELYNAGKKMREAAVSEIKNLYLLEKNMNFRNDPTFQVTGLINYGDIVDELLRQEKRPEFCRVADNGLLRHDFQELSQTILKYLPLISVPMLSPARLALLSEVGSSAGFSALTALQLNEDIKKSYISPKDIGATLKKQVDVDETQKELNDSFFVAPAMAWASGTLSHGFVKWLSK